MNKRGNYPVCGMYSCSSLQLLLHFIILSEMAPRNVWQGSSEDLYEALEKHATSVSFINYPYERAKVSFAKLDI